MAGTENGINLAEFAGAHTVVKDGRKPRLDVDRERGQHDTDVAFYLGLRLVEQVGTGTPENRDFTHHVCPPIQVGGGIELQLSGRTHTMRVPAENSVTVTARYPQKGDEPAKEVTLLRYASTVVPDKHSFPATLTYAGDTDPSPRKRRRARQLMNSLAVGLGVPGLVRS